ncbi:MAG: site-specific integrase [Chloroflexota bacterium]
MSAESNPQQTTAHLTPDTPLAPAIYAWQISLQDQERSIHTIKAFTADMRLLVDYLPPDRTLGNISTRDLNNFLDWLQNERGVPCSPKTLSRRITSIKAFFRWLHQFGVVLIDPAEKVVQKSVLSPLPEVLTLDEQKRALETAEQRRYDPQPDARPYALLALLLHTGIKKGECLNLKLNHLDEDSPEGAILFIRYANPKHRYRERKIALPEHWLPAFHEYLAQYTPTDRIFPWSPRRLEYLLEDIGEEAGLSKHLSFSMCRWTSALNDLHTGMDPNAIRQKLGVSEFQWRELYMKLRRLASGFR